MGSVEVGNAEKQDDGVCGHFSIRGYVAGVRKKDTTAGWPFSIHKDFEKLAASLPPMDVPNFRWWDCQDCLTRATNMTAEEVTECYKNGFKKRISSHGYAVVSYHGDPPRLVSCAHQASKNILEGMNADPDTPGVNGDKCDPLCGHKKGKEAAAVHPIRDDTHTCKSCGDNAVKNVNQVNNATIPGATIVVPGLIVDIFGTTEPSDLNGSLEKDKHGRNSIFAGAEIVSQSLYSDKNVLKDLSDLALDAGNLKGNGKKSTEICDKERLGISRNSPTKSNNQHEKVMTDCGITEVADMDTDKNETTELHSKELAENDEIFARRDQHVPSQQDVSGGTSQRKKQRKKRSLTEIIESEKKDTSKNGRTSERDPCTDNIMMKAARDKAETRAPDVVYTYPDQRSLAAVQGNDQRVVLGKKRKMINMSEEEDQWSRMNMPNDAPEAEIGSVKIVDSGHLTKHKNDVKFSLDKKKRKRSKVEKGKSSSTPWKGSMSGEGLFTRRNVETEQTRVESIPSNSERDASTGRGRSAAKRDDKKVISGLTIGEVQQGLDHMNKDKKAVLDNKRNDMPQEEGGRNVPQFTLFGNKISVVPEAPPACNYENSTDNQRHQYVSKMQSDEIAKKTSSQATFDDIPMDIVELMAKNQHERSLFSGQGTNGSSNSLSGTTQKGKDAGAKDFSEILGNGMSTFLYENHSGLQKNHSSNEESSTSAKGKGVILANQKSDGYLFPVNRKNKNISFNMNQHEESHHGSLGFAAFSHNHVTPSRVPQFPARGSDGYCGKNFSWNVDVVSHRCSSSCLPSTCKEAYRMSQRPSAHSSCVEDRHAWSSMVPSRVPFSINSHQKVVADSSNLKMLSQCAEPLPGGNSYRDHDLMSMDQNNFQLQTQGRDFDCSQNKGKNCTSQFLFTKRGDDSHLQKMGSLDLYNNETIPAMDLLKLMDACKKFPKPPPYPNNDLQLRLEIEQSKTLRHPLPSDLFNTISPPSSHEQFSSVLKLSTAGSSSQKNENLRRDTGSAARVSEKVASYSLKSQVKEKTKRKNPAPQPTGLRSNGSGEYHESVSVHNLQKGSSSASEYMPFVRHSQAMKNPNINVELEVNKKYGSTWPVTTSCSTEICSLNRNPADFSAPGQGNMYMIGSADLKLQKTTPSRDEPGPSNQISHKRHRMTRKLKNAQRKSHN